MPRLHGTKKDFGLQREAGVSLPGFQASSNVSSSSSSTASYSSTMPAYRQGGGRGHHGGFSPSGAPPAGREPARRTGGTYNGDAHTPEKTAGGRNGLPGAGEEQKKSRGWFGKSKKSTKKKDRVPVSVIDEVADQHSPSPILQARGGGGEGRDQFGRPRPELEAPEDEELRMHLSYDAPVDITKSASELVRLILRPAGKVSEALQVTLRRRGQGFGLQLSPGLPPITVQYVEPGGAAESAGVSVGDVVLEVNGELCEGCDPAKVLALKSMIQQTQVLGSDGKNTMESNALNDKTWSKIQARQLQDEAESRQSQSKPELTHIDGDSEKEKAAGHGKLHNPTQPGTSGERVQLVSESEWERMRVQRDLVFDKNALSAVIQRQAGPREIPAGTRPAPLSSQSSPPRTAETRQPREPLSSPEKRDTPTKPSSSSGGGGGGWFKKKKKNKETKSSDIEAKQKSASLPRSLTGAVNSSKTTSKKPQKGGMVMKVTSIDDVESGGETESSGDGIKKTFSYEGMLLSGSHDGHVTTSLPRSRSHNAMFRATIIQAAVQHQQHNHSRAQSSDATLDGPTISHSRSKSYEDKEGDEMERERGDVVNWNGEGLKFEARQTSLSQSDISRMSVEEKRGGVQVEPNLRLKKSGVVKETSSWGQRPTLEVFGTADAKRKEDEGKPGVEDSTDGPETPYTAGTPTDDQPVDIGVIPTTRPSLGRRAGHTRRDLVARSSVKRRLPTNKGSLLLKVDDSQLMGTKRVDLTELSPTHRPRTRTMPEKVSRRLIEAGPRPQSPADKKETQLVQKDQHLDKKKELFPDLKKEDHLPDKKKELFPDKKKELFPDKKKELTPEKKKELFPDKKKELLPDKKREEQRSDKLQESSEGGAVATVSSPGTTQSILQTLMQQNTNSSSTGGSEPTTSAQQNTAATPLTTPTTPAPVGSSAEMVALAVALRNSTVISSTEEATGGGGTAEGKRRESESERERISHKETAGGAILARLRQEREVVREKEKEEEVKGESPNSSAEARLRRRNKTVEKPVKSLGIASEREETATKPSSTPQQLPLVNLRKKPSSEPRPLPSTSLSSSTTPSWVAMAEKKKQRVSALLKRNSSTEAQSPPPDTEAPPTLSPTSPALPAQATPPVTTPTAKSDKAVTSPVKHSTTNTPPSKPIVPPVTKGTPHTGTTSTPVTKLTSPPVSKPTPTKTTPPNSTHSPSPSNKEPEGGRPKKGTVRDRLAFFQK